MGAKRMVGLVGLVALVGLGCGEKEPTEAEDTGSDDPLEQLPEGLCAEFVNAVYDCYDVAGQDVAELGLTADYCDPYDESDPNVAEWFQCYVDAMADIDCAGDWDEARHQIGLVPNVCGAGR